MREVSKLWRIGVHAHADFLLLRNLFNALEMLFPVRFESRSPEAWGELDAGLLLSETGEKFSAASASGVRFYAVAGVPDAAVPQSARTDFNDNKLLDRRLRGQSITDSRIAGSIDLPMEPSDVVLASWTQGPLWIRRRGSAPADIVALGPEELEDGEPLRNALRTDRTGRENFIRLLPLIHFLRELTAEAAWSKPPLRATFLIDDPNLNRPTYGFLSFPKLAFHAAQHGYHAAVATIPLDSRCRRPAMASLFNQFQRNLSLIFHGNDHIKHELERPQCAEDGLMLLGSALRRMKAFEARSRCRVESVMSAPHAVASAATCRAMLLLGFDAICTNMPHPWLRHMPREMPLAGTNPAEFVCGGLPVLQRCSFAHWRRHAGHREDVVLRAFLDMPIIFSGHHDDCAEGLDAFAEAAAQVNALGKTEWMSLGNMLRTNYATRREGNRLRVRLYSRRISLEVPPEIDEVIVETPPAEGGKDDETIMCGGAVKTLHGGDAGGASDTFRVRPGETLVIALSHPDAIDLQDVPPDEIRVWPLMRRTATVARDRMMPLLRGFQRAWP